MTPTQVRTWLKLGLSHFSVIIWKFTGGEGMGQSMRCGEMMLWSTVEGSQRLLLMVLLHTLLVKNLLEVILIAVLWLGRVVNLSKMGRRVMKGVQHSKELSLDLPTLSLTPHLACRVVLPFFFLSLYSSMQNSIQSFLKVPIKIAGKDHERRKK